MFDHTKLRALIAALVGAALIAAAIGSATVAASPSATKAAGKGKATTKIPQKTCFWTDIVATKFTGDDPDENFAFPDTGAVYWTSKLSIPEGATVTLKGIYAHARYTSLNSYTRTDNSPTDALNDVSTIPDQGSKNPFLGGAKRNTPNQKRKYTVNVLNETVPPNKAPNTLYAGVEGQDQQQLIYRVYVPDSFKQKELTGGVGLPKAKVKLADKTVLKGDAACEALSIEPGRLDVTTLPPALYDSLRGDSATGPAEDPAEWWAFYNIPWLLGCEYSGNCGGDPERTGGQYSNTDNTYVSTFGSRAFPDGPVMVLKGKMPSFAKTGKKVNRMPAGDLRYWSLCQNESFLTTAGAGCLYDSQVPTNKKGKYTIVTSLPGDRPKNAKPKCGVGFIPWPERGDGAGNTNDSLLVLRNMLPASDFDQAIQNTETPGDEAEVMGPYLPKGTYTTKAAFQKKGC